MSVHDMYTLHEMDTAFNPTLNSSDRPHLVVGVDLERDPTYSDPDLAQIEASMPTNIDPKQEGFWLNFLVARQAPRSPHGIRSTTSHLYPLFLYCRAVIQKTAEDIFSTEYIAYDREDELGCDMNSNDHDNVGCDYDYNGIPQFPDENMDPNPVSAAQDLECDIQAPYKCHALKGHFI